MSKIRDQVKLFHRKFGIQDLETPGIPEEKIIKLRLRMLFEEYQELTEALGFPYQACLHEHMAEIHAWEPDVSKVDVVEVADALGDIDYLTEGTRLAFGIDGDYKKGLSIQDEIQRTNMEKEGGGTDNGGKIRKPPGWTGPRIRESLIQQGWTPDDNGVNHVTVTTT